MHTNYTNKKISTLTGVLIIVAAAGVLFGGVFGWQNYFVKNEWLREKQDFKIYKNELIGLEFEYPGYFVQDNDWPYLFLTENNTDNSRRKSKNISLSLNVCEMCSEPVIPFIEAVSQIKDEELAIEDNRFVSFTKTLNITMNQSIEVVSYEKLEYTLKENEESEKSDINSYVYFPTVYAIIKYGDGSMVLGVRGKEETITAIEKIKHKNYTDFIELEDIASKILATFKFTK